MIKRLRKFKNRWTKIAGYRVFEDSEDTMDLERDFPTGGGDERIAFGTMAKGQKKYGSVAKSHKRDESAGFEYTVGRGDTLQGLAVKFGVSTELLRRTNHLWTNDSLFLRDKLLIPIVCENGNEPEEGTFRTSHNSTETQTGTNGAGSSRNQHSPTHRHANNGSNCSPDESFESSSGGGPGRRWTSHPLSDSFESEDCFSSPNSSKLESESPEPVAAKSTNPFWTPGAGGSDSNPGTSNGQTGQTTPHSHSTPTSPSPGKSGRMYMVKDHSDNSFKDFLSRIDNAIETSRKQAKADLSNSAQWVTFESDSESDNQRGSGTSLRTQGRHLRYSLRKLEKAQDELFQL